RSTASGSMSRTWNGSDLCISLAGRFDTAISRTTSCGLVTPSRTCLVSNLQAAAVLGAGGRRRLPEVVKRVLALGAACLDVGDGGRADVQPDRVDASHRF